MNRLFSKYITPKIYMPIHHEKKRKVNNKLPHSRQDMPIHHEKKEK